MGRGAGRVGRNRATRNCAACVAYRPRSTISTPHASAAFPARGSTRRAPAYNARIAAAVGARVAIERGGGGRMLYKYRESDDRWSWYFAEAF